MSFKDLSNPNPSVILGKSLYSNECIGRFITVDVLMFMKHLDGVPERKELVAFLTEMMLL